mgnify:CR=1 FL=1
MLSTLPGEACSGGAAPMGDGVALPASGGGDAAATAAAAAAAAATAAAPAAAIATASEVEVALPSEADGDSDTSGPPSDDAPLAAGHSVSCAAAAAAPPLPADTLMRRTWLKACSQWMMV